MKLEWYRFDLSSTIWLKNAFRRPALVSEKGVPSAMRMNYLKMWRTINRLHDTARDHDSFWRIPLSRAPTFSFSISRPQRYWIKGKTLICHGSVRRLCNRIFSADDARQEVSSAADELVIIYGGGWNFGRHFRFICGGGWNFRRNFRKLCSSI